MPSCGSRAASPLKTAIVLVTASCGCGSSGTSPVVPVEPTPTVMGTPNGAAATQIIGVAGGELATADGRLSVEVPAGALAADTELSIQPISSMAPSGVGAAYRLTPEGTTFAQPVTLRFRYDAADTTGSAPELLAVSFQDSAGYWRVPPDQSLDTAAGTLSIASSHFSDWSLLQDVQIQPSSASVRNDTNQALSLIACRREEVTMQDDGPRYTCREGDPQRYAVTSWQVNGQAGGNATVGTVARAGAGRATYHAPHTAPRLNTVQVAAELQAAGGAKALVFASLAIYDDTFVVEGHWQAVVLYTHTRPSQDGSSFSETLMTEATLVGSMGVIVTESGTMTVDYTSVSPITGGNCTETIKGTGPLQPFTPSLPTGAIGFFPVAGDENVYYFIGVPFAADVPASQDIACTGSDTVHYDIVHGGFWLVIPSQFTSAGYKTSRSLDSMSGTYEQTGDGPESWTWTITRVSGI